MPDKQACEAWWICVLGLKSVVSQRHSIYEAIFCENLQNPQIMISTWSDNRCRFYETARKYLSQNGVDICLKTVMLQSTTQCQQPPVNRPAACSHTPHISPKVVDTQRFRIPPLNRVAESLAFKPSTFFLCCLRSQAFCLNQWRGQSVELCLNEERGFPCRVMRQQQREPYTRNVYVRFIRKVNAGNSFFLFYKFHSRHILFHLVNTRRLIDRRHLWLHHKRHQAISDLEINQYILYFMMPCMSHKYRQSCWHARFRIPLYSSIYDWICGNPTCRIHCTQ